MQRVRRDQGFTLIEIISVILIVGVMVAVAVPMFDTSGISVAEAASIIKSDIRFVQELALSRNPDTEGEVGITFAVGQTSYSIIDPQGIFTTTTRDLPDGVSITTAPATTGNVISFNKFGEPEFTSATVTIEVGSSGQTKSIVIQKYTGTITIS
ncbi:MAG: prepilin-type N-terminal cleavage/methylation domain-containing protein [Nitrospinae bacterium]|nr:prepilin-type N-terminal cleavage/methylation domain-containing protein [Nitrospinota bacterium]